MAQGLSKSAGPLTRSLLRLRFDLSDPLLERGGLKRDSALFWGDFLNGQGFTGISERLAPDQLVQFLNRFLSEATRDVALESIAWRKVGSVKVVGRNEPVVVYQPLDNTYDVALVRNLSTYNDALALFEAGRIPHARELFDRLGDDPVGIAYRARIERMISSKDRETSVWDVKEK